jgi:hybrid cluster-associated redox disulfide protein
MAPFSLADRDLTVDEVMTRWPRTIRVFIDRRMHCVGCPVGGLHSLKEAALAHAILPSRLLAEIAAAANDPEIS